MQFRFLFCSLITVFLALTLPTFGQVAQWDFENLTASTPIPPIAASSSISQVSASVGLTGAVSSGSPAECGSDNVWSTRQWTSNGTRDIGKYLEFLVSVNSGAISISSFSFQGNRTNDGPQAFDVYYSLNNFSTENFLFSGSLSTTCNSKNGSLDVMVNSGNNIRFRVYGYSHISNIATFRIDNVTISGSFLPIELLSFKGQQDENQIDLTWTTAVEINNDYMAVERSTDGRQFAEIGRVPGAGTTSVPQHYTFTDRTPALGTNYYRLRQVDLDGTANFHSIIAVEYTDRNQEEPLLEIFPTVASDHLRWKSHTVWQKELPYQIYNLAGQLAGQGLMYSSSQEIPIRDLTAGNYFLRVILPNEVITLPFLKQ